MPGFAENFIAGHQAGLQRRNQEQQFQDAQEERGIRKMLLDLQLRHDKLSEAVQKRELAKSNLDLLNGQQFSDIAQPIQEGQTNGGFDLALFKPGQGVPQQTAIQPVNIPGVDELGIPGVSVKPKSLEEILAAQRNAELQKVLLTPQKTGPGETVTVPGLGPEPIASGGEKPTTRQAEWGVVDGKQVAISFDPTSGKRYDAAGNDVTAKVKPIPPASLQIQNQPPPTIAPGSPDYKIAQKLASGQLTFTQFRGLYPNRASDAGLKRAVYDMASELNPNFNPAQFEIGFKMASNPQINQRVVAINSLYPVIDQIEALSQQVPRGDIQAFNRLLIGGKVQIGNRKAITFQQLKTLLGDEVGNALGVGSGSDLKTKIGLDLVNANLGDGSFQDTMEQLRNVLGARRDALVQTMGPYGGNAAPPPAPKTEAPKKELKVGGFTVQVH